MVDTSRFFLDWDGDTGSLIGMRLLLKSCVFCRRQFGAPLTQKMADLPLDRIHPAGVLFRSDFGEMGPVSSEALWSALQVLGIPSGSH